MRQYSKVLRSQSRSLVVTIPYQLVDEMGLVVGDIAIFKREPDGLRLRIIRPPKQDEPANETENPTALKNAPEQEEAVVDST
jgi:hypothetical protein